MSLVWLAFFWVSGRVDAIRMRMETRRAIRSKAWRR